MRARNDRKDMTTIASTRPKRQIKVPIKFDPSSKIISPPKIVTKTTGQKTKPVKKLPAENIKLIEKPKRTTRSKKVSDFNTQIEDQKKTSEKNDQKRTRRVEKLPTESSNLIEKPQTVNRSKKVSVDTEDELKKKSERIRQKRTTKETPSNVSSVRNDKNVERNLRRKMIPSTENTKKKSKEIVAQKKKIEKDEVLTISDDELPSKPRRIIMTPLKNRTTHDVKESALLYRYQPQNRMAKGNTATNDRSNEKMSNVEAASKRRVFTSTPLPTAQTLRQKGRIPVSKPTNFKVPKAHSRHETISKTIIKTPIYKTVKEPSKSNENTELSIYDYFSNSQDSMTENKENSMDDILKKLQRENKILLKRKPYKRKLATDDQSRTKPIWAETRKNMRMKRGIRELKSNLKTNLIMENVLNNIEQRQKFNAEMQIASITNAEINVRNNQNSSNSSCPSEFNNNSSNELNSLHGNSNDKNDDKSTSDNAENIENNQNLDNNHLDDVDNDFDDSALPPIEESIVDDVSTVDLSRISKKTYSRLSSIKDRSIDNDLGKKQRLGHFQSTPVRMTTSIIGGKSPWRIEYNQMASSFYFKTSKDYLPSVSTDVIGPKAKKTMNIQRTTPVAQNIPCRQSVSFLTDLSNTSNIENVQPNNHDKTANENSFPVVVEKRKGPRSPLKPLAIRSTLNMPQHLLEKHKNVGHKDEQGSIDETTWSIQNYFGFDTDDEIDDEITTNTNQIHSKQVSQYSNKLKEKLKGLRKYLTPPKRIGPRRKPLAKNSIKPSTSKSVFTINIKQQKLDDILNAKKAIETTNNASIIDDNNDDNVVVNTDQSPVLFQSFWGNENDKLQNTYSRVKKRKRYLSTSYSDAEDEDNEGEVELIKKTKKPKQTKNKQDKQWNNQLNQFADQFNSMCEEVDKYELVVET